ncbi:MAG TPA: DUF4349 domain-containing protein [Terriglobales bacterium]|nr:DUF4349 domain-containing protein [Terriglobales bacterium]
MTGLAANPPFPRRYLVLMLLPWALLLLLLVAAVVVPNLLRSRMAVRQAMDVPVEGALDKYASVAPGAAGGESKSVQAAFDRKIVRTGAMELVVKDAPAAVAQLQALAERLGGYVESSNLTQVGDSMNGSVKLRIPAARFDEARAGAHGIGLRVQSESVEATDVTRQFVDLEASLRNFRAEEAQYLEILKRASRTEDVLQVAEHLSDVRGRIERTQGELNLLSHQVEMSTLTVNLVAQAEARVLGLEWRPLYNARRAFRDLLQGLADYTDSMVALVIALPLIVLWAATVIFFAVLAWKILRWVWRRFLKRAPAAPPA